MFASVPGQVPQSLKGPGKKLVGELEKELGGAVELYAPYAGQAASVLLGAIAKGSDRPGVIAAVNSTKVRNGITTIEEVLRVTQIEQHLDALGDDTKTEIWVKK